MSNRWISSLQDYSHNSNSPYSIYFPFGAEREKMKSYVFDQLHGKQTLQNQEILKKFREQALVRRHRHLHRYSQIEIQKNSSLVNEEQALPTLGIRKNPQSNFMNSLPRQYRYNSLIPREKSPPPISKYSRLQGFIEKQKSIKSNQTIKRKKIREPIILSNSKKKSQSVQIRVPFKQTALAKIKEIAKKRRQKDNQQSCINSTDSSQIMEQLQHKVKQSKLEYDHVSKQLKRFKEYRRYVKKSRT